jgi:hypothetical protein
MKTIDPHGTALDLLHDERDVLEEALRDVTPKINNLMRMYTAKNMTAYVLACALWGGDISKLAKLRNELRRRLNSVEETRKLLKEDRANQLEDAWENEQYRLEGEKLLSEGSYNCLGGC